MAEGDPAPSGGGIFDKVNQRIVVLGGVATMVVGLGAQLNSCAEAKVQHYAAFRTAVAAEEAFWKARLDDYVAIAAEEKDIVRKRKELALNAVSAHGVPSFAEYRIAMIDGRDEVQLARKRLEQMKTDLAAALATSENPEVAVPAKAAVAFDDSQAALVARTVDQSAPPAPANPAAPARFAVNPISDTPNPNTQVLVRGAPKGWDIDVFWCASNTAATEQANYARAREAARILSTQSASGGSIADSVFLGQIRLRPLPLLRQGGGYPAPGSNLTVRAEADDAEQTAAKALIAQLGGRFVLGSSATPTKWYLSVFVCLANLAPAAA